MITALLLFIALLLAASGIALAWGIYRRRESPSWWERSMVHRVLAYQCYIDEMYDALVVEPLRGLSRLSQAFDARGIDGVVEGVARITGRGADLLRQLQTGRLPHYVLFFLAGVVAIVSYFLLRRSGGG